MEKILYFDCFSGISGDMCLGALIDIGLDSDAVMKELNKLGLKGFDIKINKINKYSINGIDVKVTIDGSGDCVHENHIEGYQESHSHEHGHTHRHDEKERNLADISHIIRSSGISQRAKDLTMAVFTEIARAEAAVHGKLIDEIHFHEVGAIDSIVDIAGTAICLDMLKADRIICSPVHEGHGFINCRHGKLPVPVPAVIKMLENSEIPIVTEDIEAELVTPTGFGILKTVAESCGRVPKMMVESVGYGFGKTDTGSLNALRVILGSSEEQEIDTSIVTDNGNIRETVTLLETNIDNTTGEMMGYAMERLMKAGALDSWFTPVQMKKNRPACMLSVLCKRNDAEKLSDIIFMETSTIGIRIRETERIALKREISIVKTELGEARVKEVSVRGHLRIQPEYEDCARLAEENNLSINEVYEIVKRSHYGKEFGKNI
ncbi:MAG: nickel pincer cofactor biosynthesis protein LarC [Eubacteriales bacterium]|nr:nickel pincer cofactor biosynthesis protein LarC [Eubacteriales bacterium]MDD3199588.1 nickel pincer cofactor biosynthesis protein LarC [Eubacteriales bacterium]MDD4629300.1 nickel pincer cofactor biosynthesis protein LarC [Eubacteriales bacterium]